MNASVKHTQSSNEEEGWIQHWKVLWSATEKHDAAGKQIYICMAFLLILTVVGVGQTPISGSEVGSIYLHTRLKSWL